MHAGDSPVPLQPPTSLLSHRQDRRVSSSPVLSLVFSLIDLFFLTDSKDNIDCSLDVCAVENMNRVLSVSAPIIDRGTQTTSYPSTMKTCASSSDNYFIVYILNSCTGHALNTASCSRSFADPLRFLLARMAGSNEALPRLCFLGLLLCLCYSSAAAASTPDLLYLNLLV